MGRIRTQAEIGNGVVLREEEVGRATSRICYPGVSSCITITCVSASFLNGCHLTNRTEPEKVDTALSILKQYCTNGVAAIYVVGKVADFKLRTVDKRLNTRKKISKLLRDTFGFKGSKIDFCDVAPYGRDFNIAVTRTLTAVQFGLQDDRTKVAGDTLPADLNDYKPILALAFERR